MGHIILFLNNTINSQFIPFYILLKSLMCLVAIHMHVIIFVRRYCSTKKQRNDINVFFFVCFFVVFFLCFAYDGSIAESCIYCCDTTMRKRIT